MNGVRERKGHEAGTGHRKQRTHESRRVTMGVQVPEHERYIRAGGNDAGKGTRNTKGT